MLTIKSDDVVGRAKAFEAIVKGVDIPTPKVPESFKVLVKELQGLGLNVVPTGAVIAKEDVEAEVAPIEEKPVLIAQVGTEGGLKTPETPPVGGGQVANADVSKMSVQEEMKT
jgi:DNA-directed RNA polymerase subunit beta